MYEEVEVVESRESERVMATDTRAGVMFEVGDEKYMVVFCACCSSVGMLIKSSGDGNSLEKRTLRVNDFGGARCM